jgi:hypothetical protein
MSTLFNTLTNPKRYVSLIERELQKNRLAPLSEKKDFMKFIPFLPAELKREIFKCIDFETRISMMLEKRPYLVRGPERLPEETLNANQQNPFHSLFSGSDMAKIYLNGFVKQIFEYNENTRRWGLKSDSKKLFPFDNIITISGGSQNVNLRAGTRNVLYNNTAHSVLDVFRKKYPVNNNSISATQREVSSVPICALSLLLKTNYNSEIDYYFRKKGFQFMIAIDCYIQNKYEQARIRRANARRERQLRNENLLMLNAERETRVYNKLKEQADKKATAIAREAATATANAERRAAIIARKAAIATAKAEKKATAIAKKLAIATAKAEKRATAIAKKLAIATAKEVRNNEYYLNQIMGFGRLNL